MHSEREYPCKGHKKGCVAVDNLTFQRDLKEDRLVVEIIHQVRADHNPQFTQLKVLWIKCCITQARSGEMTQIT